MPAVSTSPRYRLAYFDCSHSSGLANVRSGVKEVVEVSLDDDVRYRRYLTAFAICGPRDAWNSGSPSFRSGKCRLLHIFSKKHETDSLELSRANMYEYGPGMTTPASLETELLVVLR